MNVGIEVVEMYPISNNQWQFMYEWHIGIVSYMMRIVDNEVVMDDLRRKYAGVRGIFVRHSGYDDDDSLGYEYNNVDPWFRKFKAYKNGNKTRYDKQYMCDPIFDDKFSIREPKAYVLTTSVGGSMIYCLDVIESIKV